MLTPRPPNRRSRVMWGAEDARCSGLARGCEGVARSLLVARAGGDRTPPRQPLLVSQSGCGGRERGPFHGADREVGVVDLDAVIATVSKMCGVSGSTWTSRNSTWRPRLLELSRSPLASWPRGRAICLRGTDGDAVWSDDRARARRCRDCSVRPGSVSAAARNPVRGRSRHPAVCGHRHRLHDRGHSHLGRGTIIGLTDSASPIPGGCGRC